MSDQIITASDSGTSRAESEPVKLRSFVGGRWLSGTGGEISSLDPARPTRVVACGELSGAKLLDAACRAAEKALPQWRAASIHDRADVLRRAADWIDGRRDGLANDLTRELGKIGREASGEIARTSATLRYNAALADAVQGEVYAGRRPNEQILTRRAPLGPILLITPWNLPIAIPSWKLAPALLYGNTVVWKPASITPLMAQRLVEALEAAGLPPGVVNLVFAGGAEAERLLDRDEIVGCAFTGSTRVGRRLMLLGAERGKRVQAEMGGKNAAVVLADADLNFAVDQVLSGAMYHAGQRCTATSRVLVERPVYEEFVASLVDRADRLRVGDPADAATDVGPVASADQWRTVTDYAEVGVSQGATRLTRPTSPRSAADTGFFVRPTILADVTVEDRIYLEEVFGPLCAVIPVDSCDQAFELANRGRYGLSAAIFTANLDHVLRAMETLAVGVLHINSETCGADPHVPFGGVKDSGSAHREMGLAAREFFTELQTVYLHGSRQST